MIDENQFKEFWGVPQPNSVRNLPRGSNIADRLQEVVGGLAKVAICYVPYWGDKYFLKMINEINKKAVKEKKPPMSKKQINTYKVSFFVLKYVLNPTVLISTMIDAYKLNKP
jgi:hypothetical protein